MDVLQIIHRVRDFWRGIPEQGKRLTILAVIFLVLFFPVRSYFTPSGFGKYGHYRAAALEANADLPLYYAGHVVCDDCHDEIVELKSNGYHVNVACEVCHGPAAAHVDDPDVELAAPRERGYCPLCHGYLSSRPTGFPQIVPAAHNPLKACISCHNPHDPVPPVTPRECEACHAAIARTKAVSHHTYVPCTRCHQVPEEHKVSPREHRAGKPASREVCGSCHSEDAVDSEVEPRVDMATHGERYVCWQCHYPHLPEAR